MALDPLQVHVARIALALPEARTLALAGGGAMIVHGFADRATKDIDLFTKTLALWARRTTRLPRCGCPFGRSMAVGVCLSLPQRRTVIYGADIRRCSSDDSTYHT